MTRRAELFAVAVLAALAAVAQTARAQDAAWSLNACRNVTGEYSYDVITISCSRVIAAGQASTADLATAHYMLGKTTSTEEAIVDFGHAIRLNPTYMAAYLARAEARARFGDSLGAISDYNTAIQIQPFNAEAFFGRGEAYAALGDYPSAIADHGSSLGVNPLYAKPFLGRCVARLLSGKEFDLALVDCNRSVELDPGNDAHLFRGIVEYRLGDFHSAYGDFSAALGYDDLDMRAVYGKGVALIRLGNAAAGRALIQTAISEDPYVAADFAEVGLAP